MKCNTRNKQRSDIENQNRSQKSTITLWLDKATVAGFSSGQISRYRHEELGEAVCTRGTLLIHVRHLGGSGSVLKYFLICQSSLQNFDAFLSRSFASSSDSRLSQRWQNISLFPEALSAGSGRVLSVRYSFFDRTWSLISLLASSTGLLLKTAGLKVTAIKIDPYMNIDAGTMRPTEHGEIRVRMFLHKHLTFHQVKFTF